MRGTEIDWRGMTGFDLPAIERIAAAVHPDYFESLDVLAERRTLYHDGAYVLEVGERIAGYVLSHPWRHGDTPALNTLIGRLPDGADTYYIHDIALLPLARKIGAASQMVESLIKHAAASGYQSVSLVAVNRSEAFWTRFGFAVEEVADLAEKLLSYDGDARYMV
ncbi:MAG: GNAT family N-acetyltransferase, partial [Alphaproteobacteria bacterium]|nr:GNAT family N-acetyltransferase [Alphaproteobacteria bacterium]